MKRIIPKCDMAYTDSDVRLCNRVSVQSRIWAQNELRFCAKHAQEWDELVTWALVDFYSERKGDDPINAFGNGSRGR